jgi:RNA polymerase sigma factor (sigma-70 family)
MNIEGGAAAVGSVIDQIDLITQINRGDPQAFSTLYDQYAPHIYNLLMRFVHREDKAEELLQEVFTKVWLKSHTYKPELGSVGTWLNRICRNTAIDYIRRERAAHEVVADELQQIEDSRAFNEYECVHIRATLSVLPPPQRNAIEYIYFRGMTYIEAAQALGVPVGTLKTRVRSAMNKLREEYGAVPKEESISGT